MAHHVTNLPIPHDHTPVENESVDYHQAWKAFAFRHNLALFFLYSWVPLCVGLFFASRFYLHVPLTSLVVMALWLVAALAAVWWAGEYRCPRCRRRYAALGHKSGTSNVTRGIFDKVCSNCKLTKFEIVKQ